MKTLLHMLHDDSGAAAAEYALILAIVGAAIALAAVNLGAAVSNAMENATNCINNPPSAGGSTATCAAGSGSGTAST